MRRDINGIIHRTLMIIFPVLLVLSGLENASAQRRPGKKKSTRAIVRNPNAAAPRLPVPSEEEKLRAAVAAAGEKSDKQKKIEKAVEEACTGLQNIMNLAKSDFSAFPYFENTPDANFTNYCKDQGELRWQSVKKLKNMVSSDTFGVKLKVLDLKKDEISIKDGGRVLLMAKSPLIAIIAPVKDGGAPGPDEYRMLWFVDLGKNYHGDAFINEINKLHDNLNEKQKMVDKQEWK